jgi:hypothetical protein
MINIDLGCLSIRRIPIEYCRQQTKHGELNGWCFRWAQGSLLRPKHFLSRTATMLAPAFWASKKYRIIMERLGTDEGQDQRGCFTHVSWSRFVFMFGRFCGVFFVVSLGAPQVIPPCGWCAPGFYKVVRPSTRARGDQTVSLKTFESLKIGELVLSKNKDGFKDLQAHYFGLDILDSLMRYIYVVKKHPLRPV